MLPSAVDVAAHLVVVKVPLAVADWTVECDDDGACKQAGACDNEKDHGLVH
jgi:hypothetical protein